MKRMKMARSPSNKGITNRNANVMYAPPNTQDNTRGIIPGLTAGTTYGEGQDIKEQVQATGGLPDASLATSTALFTALTQTVLHS